jgi:O-methyltransferase involved in polyketide biosynthesis
MADPDHDPISYTALKVLQQRARHCTIPLCREMAEATGIPWKSAWPKRAVRRLIGGKVESGLYLQLRFDAMSRALEAYSGCPILELAAGFGTRGILESPHREAYIETDLKALQIRKEQVVKKLLGGTLTPHHYFQAANATDVGDMRRLESFVSALNLRKPIVIIHEGLLMYFNEKERAMVRDCIARLMGNHEPGGVWLTSDFSERDTDQSPLQQLMSFRLRGRVGRRLNYFTDNDSVVQFLRTGNLNCEWLANTVPMADAKTRAYAEYFRIHKITL